MTVRGTDGAGGSEGLTGTFGRRLVLAVDARGYGRAGAPLQRQFQAAIPLVLGRAAEASGLDRDQWLRQVAGDSEFAVLPRNASEPALVDRFMRALEAELREFNSTRLREAWLELRAAVHFGPVSRGDNGFVGDAPVEVGRILDSAPLRAALAAVPGACLAVGVSPTVFNDVVRQAYTTLRVSEFREVRVRAKEHDGPAWVWLPGHDLSDVPLDSGPDAGPRPADTTPEAPGTGPCRPGAETSGPAGGREEEARPGPGRGTGPGRASEPPAAGDRVEQHFYGTVNAAGAVFGSSR
ncbi:hypothetical protein ACF065_26610 [Streptomyces sp. NPDC015232]|uniref:hypothetical protein n=1 Tax=unclassified Streptomyces TaxID=2593676 RepID=UPI0036FAFD03